MRRHLALSATLLLLAAGGCSGRSADFWVHGVGVAVKTNAPFAHRADISSRIEGVLAAGLAYWGGSWSDLEGSEITLLDGPYVTCASSDHATGCYDGDLTISTADPGSGTFQCVEQTVLVHEIGHAVIGDPQHADPRWMEFDALASSLAGRTGYTAAGETDCLIFVSVWRHPPGP